MEIFQNSFKDLFLQNKFFMENMVRLIKVKFVLKVLKFQFQIQKILFNIQIIIHIKFNYNSKIVIMEIFILLNFYLVVHAKNITIL